MRGTVLVWSALSGAVVAGILATLAVGAAAVVSSALPLPDPLARLLDRRGVVLAVTVVAVALLIGATLGYLEGRLKLK